MTTNTDTKKWQHHLTRLRGPGARRAAKGRPSATLNALLRRLPPSSTIVDLGCGESADCKLAAQQGHKAFALDVLPPKHPTRFIQARAHELPFADCSLDGITSHAMVALLSPLERWDMYREVARVLKPDGLFSVTLYPLADGFDLRNTIEFNNMFEAGLHRVTAGIYTKCVVSKCSYHPEPESWAEIVHGIRLIDHSPDFVQMASLFVGWIVKGCNPGKTAEFAGCERAEVDSLMKNLVRVGILNADEMTMDLPWLSHYTDGEVMEGNISLMLDTLCLLERVDRRQIEGETAYRAIKL